MLILMRREEESIMIGDGIEIMVTKIQGGQVHLGITAPRDVQILRKEMLDSAEVAAGTDGDELPTVAQNE